MKKSIFTLIVTCFTIVIAIAQTPYNNVIINFNGQHRQVLIDGRTYSPKINKEYQADSREEGKKYKLVVSANTLLPGTHTLQLIRANNRRELKTEFTIRQDYDLTINVAGNGSLEKVESYRKVATSTTSTTSTTSMLPMSTSRYNLLYRQLSQMTNVTTRYNAIVSAFANTANYFTTAQARRLITMINGESFRLNLAKGAVRSITDTRNINGLTYVLASTTGRNELAAYINDYNNSTTTGNTTTGNTTTGNTTTNAGAMGDNIFSTLLNDINNRWQPGAKFNAIQSTFSNNNNYLFTTGQASQLIGLLSSEGERLQMAKDAYKKIIDQANFTQLYNLLGTQTSRDELAYFVRNNGTLGGGTTSPGTSVRTPMADYAFNTLTENIRSQWGTGAKKREVLAAFSNSNNYFTVAQASQLIQLETAENDRLDLAKSGLRSIIDPTNITQLFNVFNLQSNRQELASYINTFGGFGNVVATTTTVAMSTTNFTNFYEQTRRLWFPGAKKAAVLEAFANPDYYFTTAQASLLIALDNDEPDRFDMAKAAYNKLVDKQNFSQVYSLFTNQAYRNELEVYVRNQN